MRHLNHGCLSSPSRSESPPHTSPHPGLKPLAFMSASTTASSSNVSAGNSGPTRRCYKVALSMELSCPDNSQPQRLPAQTPLAPVTGESTASDAFGLFSHREDDASSESSGFRGSPTSQDIRSDSFSSAVSSGGHRYCRDAAPSGVSTHTSASSLLNASGIPGLSFPGLILLSLRSNTG